LYLLRDGNVNSAVAGGPIPFAIIDSSMLHIAVAYSGGTLTWTLSGSGGRRLLGSFDIDLPTIMGSEAYVGFTGGE
jgi:hypothetical protein